MGRAARIRARLDEVVDLRVAAVADAAFDRVDAWLARPQAVVVEPSPRHGAIVRVLLASAGAAGNLVTDAHLAALAVEHRGEVVTYDTDFGRFDGVRWSQPN